MSEVTYTTIRIEIDTENSAFEIDCAGEVARILRGLADKLESAWNNNPSVWEQPIHDLNGNHVGAMWAEQPR